MVIFLDHGQDLVVDEAVDHLGDGLLLVGHLCAIGCIYGHVCGVTPKFDVAAANSLTGRRPPWAPGVFTTKR